MKKYKDIFLSDQSTPGSSDSFYKYFISYADALPEEIKIQLLYDAVAKVDSVSVASKISDMIKQLNLLDFPRSRELLNDKRFDIQKRALKILTYDKPFYNKEDLNEFQSFREMIKAIFVERGTRSMKKQMLSSKEKEVWLCECGKTNDIAEYCSGCARDIYGFKSNELKPVEVDNYIQQKIELITEYLA